MKKLLLLLALSLYTVTPTIHASDPQKKKSKDEKEKMKKGYNSPSNKEKRWKKKEDQTPANQSPKNLIKKSSTSCLLSPEEELIPESFGTSYFNNAAKEFNELEKTESKIDIQEKPDSILKDDINKLSDSKELIIENNNTASAAETTSNPEKSRERLTEEIFEKVLIPEDSTNKTESPIELNSVETEMKEIDIHEKDAEIDSKDELDRFNLNEHEIVKEVNMLSELNEESDRIEKKSVFCQQAHEFFETCEQFQLENDLVKSTLKNVTFDKFDKLYSDNKDEISSGYDIACKVYEEYSSKSSVLYRLSTSIEEKTDKKNINEAKGKVAEETVLKEAFIIEKSKDADNREVTKHQKSRIANSFSVSTLTIFTATTAIAVAGYHYRAPIKNRLITFKDKILQWINRT